MGRGSSSANARRVPDAWTRIQVAYDTTSIIHSNQKTTTTARITYPAQPTPVVTIHSCGANNASSRLAPKKRVKS